MRRRALVFSPAVKWTGSSRKRFGWLARPPDSFVRRDAAKGLQAPGKIVVVEEGLQVILGLAVGLVVLPPDGRLLQRSVHRST